MDLSEFLKSLLRTEYLPVLAAVVAAVKILVPIAKAIFFANTNPKGYTSLWVAFALSAIIAFVVKSTQHVGSWDIMSILMTLIVAAIAACSSIGLNVTIQAVKGANVSIVQKE